MTCDPSDYKAVLLRAADLLAERDPANAALYREVAGSAHMRIGENTYELKDTMGKRKKAAR